MRTSPRQQLLPAHDRANPIEARRGMTIAEHRKAIDKLDTEIVRLLSERTRHVLEIGAIKLKAGEEIYAPHRELAVLQRISKLNPGPMTDDSLRAIYREVMS